MNEPMRVTKRNTILRQRIEQAEPPSPDVDAADIAELLVRIDLKHGK